MTGIDDVRAFATTEAKKWARGFAAADKDGNAELVNTESDNASRIIFDYWNWRKAEGTLPKVYDMLENAQDHRDYRGGCQYTDNGPYFTEAQELHTVSFKDATTMKMEQLVRARAKQERVSNMDHLGVFYTTFQNAANTELAQARMDNLTAYLRSEAAKPDSDKAKIIKNITGMLNDPRIKEDKSALRAILSSLSAPAAPKATTPAPVAPAAPKAITLALTPAPAKPTKVVSENGTLVPVRTGKAPATAATVAAPAAPAPAPAKPTKVVSENGTLVPVRTGKTPATAATLVAPAAPVAPAAQAAPAAPKAVAPILTATAPVKQAPAKSAPVQQSEKTAEDLNKAMLTTYRAKAKEREDAIAAVKAYDEKYGTHYASQYGV